MHPSLEPLSPLLGRWEGTGLARFPTIASADYREVLTFKADPERPLLYYEQRAQQAPVGTQAWTASHWEAGFIRLLDHEILELTNAQDNGRLEILRLRIQTIPGSLVLSGSSVGHFNDPRMVRSGRHFEVAGDTLSYEVTMATTAVPHSAVHLQARLVRAGRDPA